jgi:hypothetical protein
MKKIKIKGGSCGHGDDDYKADKNGHVIVPDHVAEIMIKHHGAEMVGSVSDDYKEPEAVPEKKSPSAGKKSKT